MPRPHQSTAEYALDVLFSVHGDAFDKATEAELGRKYEGEDDVEWFNARTHIVNELLDEMKQLNSIGLT